MVKHLYRVHLKSFRINAFEIFTKFEYILTKICKFKNANSKKCDVMELNGRIRFQQAEIILHTLTFMYICLGANF